MKQPDMAKAMQELRRSNAASPHIPRPYKRPKYKTWQLDTDEDGE